MGTCYSCGRPATKRCDLCGDPICAACVGLLVEDATEIGGGEFVACGACCAYAAEVGAPAPGAPEGLPF